MTTLHHPATRPLNCGSAAGAPAPGHMFGRRLRELLFVFLATSGLSGPVVAQEAALGADLQGLLAHARAQSPELRAMQAEAEAAAQRAIALYDDDGRRAPGQALLAQVLEAQTKWPEALDARAF